MNELNKEYFNNIAENWDNMVKRNNKKIELILSLIPIKQKSKILDIGTGTGVLINDLEKYKPSKIVAIDIAEKMIKQAREKFSYDNLVFLPIDFFDLNIYNFDLAIAYSVYPHFLNKEKFIKKLYQILNNNGRFVIAHSESKEIINERHENNKNKVNSVPLLDIFTEYKKFKEFFKIDIIIDTSDFFVISGIKKAEDSA